MNLKVLAAMFLLFTSAFAHAQETDAKLADARDLVVQKSLAEMPSAMEYLYNNSRDPQDQLLILRQAASSDPRVRSEVGILAAWMRLTPAHFDAVAPACRSLFDGARAVCIFVASRVKSPEASAALIRATLDSSEPLANAAAVALSSRALDKDQAKDLVDAFRIKADVADKSAHARWDRAMVALCGTMDQLSDDDRNLARATIEASQDPLMLERFNIFYGRGLPGGCKQDGEVHPSPD